MVRFDKIIVWHFSIFFTSFVYVKKTVICDFFQHYFAMQD